MDVVNPVNRQVRHVMEGLVKSGTCNPMQKSSTMPRQPFVELFTSWPENVHLSTEHLRLKCITLMALCLMLRPSDIAPCAKIFKQGNVVNVEYTTDRLVFQDDGSVQVYLFGIKNDYDRDGFRVYL